MPAPDSEALVPLVAALTHTGRVRKHNEDYIGYQLPDRPEIRERYGALLVVCDGVGGGAAGEVASEHAVHRLLSDYYQAPLESVPTGALIDAIQAANDDIVRENSRNPDSRSMGTTVVAAVLRGDQLVVAHAGDSRAYLIRDGEIERLTEDHSWVADMVRTGDLTPEEAASHPWRNRIMRGLGIREEVEPDVSIHQVQPGDRVLLCSDGLTRHVSDPEILDIAERYPPDRAVRRLVDLANQRGGQDNISVIIAEVLTESEAIARSREDEGMETETVVPVRPPRRRRSPMVIGVIGGLVLLAAALITLVASGLLRQGITPPGTATPSATFSPSPTAEPATAVAQNVATIPATKGVPTVTPTPTPSPTRTMAPSPTLTATSTPTATWTPTHTATATATPTHTATPSATPTPNPTAIPQLALVATMVPSWRPVLAVAFAPGDQVVVAMTGLLARYSLQTQSGGGNQVSLLGPICSREVSGTSTPLALSPSGEYLATWDRSLKLWNTASSNSTPTPVPLPADAKSVSHLAFSGDGNRLVVTYQDASDSQILLVTSVPGTGSSDRQWFTNHSGRILALALSKRGEFLALGSEDPLDSEDPKVRVWQTTGGTQVGPLKLSGHKKQVQALAFSPTDSDLLASGSDDGSVKLWNVGDTENKGLRSLNCGSAGVAEQVTSLTFSLSGTVLAAGTSGGSVCLWQVSDGTLLQTFRADRSNQNQSVKALAFSQDEKLLVTGSANGTVRLWEIK